jgi:hypothetical protein
MPHISLSAVTKLERNFVTTMVMDEVSAQGGWVEDVHLFSNIMTNIRFVMKQDSLAPFVQVLAGVGLEIGGISEIPPAGESSTDINCSLQITFAHNERDLRREIPHVPG